MPLSAIMGGSQASPECYTLFRCLCSTLTSHIIAQVWNCFFWHHGLFAYLEDEHLPPQYAQRVEASVADVWLGVGVGRPVPRRQPWRSCLPVWLAGVWGRVGARWRCCRQRLSGLGNLVRRPWKRSEKCIHLSLELAVTVATFSKSTCSDYISGDKRCNMEHIFTYPTDT